MFVGKEFLGSRQRLKIWLCAGFCSLAAFAFCAADFVRRIDWSVYESHFPTREGAQTRVVVTEIDESSLKQLGPWPLDRGLYVEAARNAFDAGAVAVVVDVMFDGEHTPEGDQRLAEFARAEKRFALAYRAIQPPGPRFYPQLALAGPTTGFIDALGGERDDIVALVAHVPGQTSLAVATAHLYCDRPGMTCIPRVRSSATDMTYKERPVHVWGINFHVREGAFVKFPFRSLVAAPMPSVEGKIVVISPAASSLNDGYWIPQGDRRAFLPGSVALAYAIETAMDGTALFVAPAWALLLAALVADVLILAACARWRRWRWAVLALCLAAMLVSHWVLFNWMQMHVPASLCVANILLLWAVSAIGWPHPKDDAESAAALDSDFLAARRR
jgi:CHASE2 domain-containing sensor protein